MENAMGFWSTHTTPHTPLRAKYWHKNGSGKEYASYDVAQPIHLVEGNIELSGHW